MKPLRVLIVNRCMSSRTGTEIYVRDLAAALQHGGHRPMVFSPQLGPLAEEMQADGIPVVDRLEDLDLTPEIIHGHHTWDTMAAIAQFPDVPAIFVGHDSTAWHDTPPRLPQIGRYVAVDYTLRERFTDRHGIDSSRISVVANPINFDRFRNRGPLPRRPRRALQISGYSGLGERAEIAAACDARGIHLDSVGHHFGNTTTEPEALLADYDLIFAKGRCAFEAAAAGAAVVVCDTWGCGPMLSSQFLDTGHGILTGRNMMSAELCSENLLRRIDEYDPDDAEKVSRRIRQTIDAGLVVDHLVDLYREVIAKHRSIDSGITKHAFCDELLWWSVHFDQVFDERSKAAARLQPKMLSLCVSTAQGSAVDFDRPFRGGGWYVPERDDQGAFCWLGPEPWAWVELVVPNADSFRLRCDLAYVLDPSILERLDVRVDGHPVKLDISTGETGIQISGAIPKAARCQSGDTVQLMFNIPRTVRPCDLNHGNSDQRALGVALRRIALEPRCETVTPGFGQEIANRLRRLLTSTEAA